MKIFQPPTYDPIPTTSLSLTSLSLSNEELVEIRRKQEQRATKSKCNFIVAEFTPDDVVYLAENFKIKDWMFSHDTRNLYYEMQGYTLFIYINFETIDDALHFKLKNDVIQCSSKRWVPSNE